MSVVAKPTPEVTNKRLASWLRNTEEVDGCWLWLGQRNSQGYARVEIAGKNYQLHRVMFELVRGPLRPEDTVDHACNRKRCVNPNHMSRMSRWANGWLGYLRRVAS